MVGHQKNLALQADALNFDFQRELEELSAPARIDYLSLDIDPVRNTSQVLSKLPHEYYRFSVITFEHDRYRNGDEYINRSRALLRSMGYQLVVENLNLFGKDFEDWWVDPAVVPELKWEPWQ